ncbi:tyrosine-protein phosphatase [Zavarzinia sp.]|uniref:tyrosine-protein phosphatase n=1 Tax=Zavarzinia sp. TaxID=2027920 RepID=UPI003563BD85
MFLRILTSASLVCLCAAAAQAADGITLTTPHLTSADNFRDLVGTTTSYTVSTYDGVLRPGVFYRSNALSLNTADLATVETLGIGLVIDLRQPSEIATKPDTVPAGASYLNVNVLGSVSLTLPMVSPATSIAYMEEINRQFVTNAAVRAELAKTLVALAQEDDAALYHCTAGKDRTGWVSAVLLSIAGVDSATIMDNYLASNSYSAGSIAATLAQLTTAYGAGFAAIYAPLLGVQASYLQAGLDQLAADYGTMDDYLKNGLGLDQATIYVLRGKLVRYGVLPGQAGLSGNAAAGAELLRALQDSDLSGAYTDYNYYLQSAIDAATLGAVPTTVGGQIHADAGAFLLRAPQRLEDATATYARGTGLGEDETRYWVAGLASYFSADGGTEAADAKEHEAGSVLGATHRFGADAVADLGAAYSAGTIDAAGASADVDVTSLTLGGRYGFAGLGAGPFVALNGSASYVDYSADRALGAGLGSASGDSSGSVFAARGAVGYLATVQGFTVEPALGLRIARADLDGFQEAGSDLALAVDAIGETRTSLLADLRIAMDNAKLGAWTVSPGFSFGYERALDSDGVTSRGTVQGVSISQQSADDGRNLFKLGFDLAASTDGITLAAGIRGIGGDNTEGVSGHIGLGLRF